jgi:glycosyltransferase involved in cell wall biosynthesis
LGLVEHVEFRPLRGLADKLRAYGDADLAVLSSRQEGLGIALLEAMATGLPAVSTKCGGPEDHLRGGQSGHLIDLDDREGYIDAVAGLLEDPERRARMGAAAAAGAREIHRRGQEALRRGLSAALSSERNHDAS